MRAHNRVKLTCLTGDVKTKNEKTDALAKQQKQNNDTMQDLWHKIRSLQDNIKPLWSNITSLQAKNKQKDGLLKHNGEHLDQLNGEMETKAKKTGKLTTDQKSKEATIGGLQHKGKHLPNKNQWKDKVPA